jgi:ATP-dependent Clp protease adapter protein ClpS
MGTTANATHKLRLMNDDINYMNIVTMRIAEILHVCDETAETLMYQAHHEGSTIVKYGSSDYLIFLSEEFKTRSLVTTIEPINLEIEPAE